MADPVQRHHLPPSVPRAAMSAVPSSAVSTADSAPRIDQDSDKPPRRVRPATGRSSAVARRAGGRVRSLWILWLAPAVLSVSEAAPAVLSSGAALGIGQRSEAGGDLSLRDGLRAPPGRFDRLGPPGPRRSPQARGPARRAPRRSAPGGGSACPASPRAACRSNRPSKCRPSRPSRHPAGRPAPPCLRSIAAGRSAPDRPASRWRRGRPRPGRPPAGQARPGFRQGHRSRARCGSGHGRRQPSAPLGRARAPNRRRDGNPAGLRPRKKRCLMAGEDSAVGPQCQGLGAAAVPGSPGRQSGRPTRLRKSGSRMSISSPPARSSAEGVER